MKNSLIVLAINFLWYTDLLSVKSTLIHVVECDRNWPLNCSLSIKGKRRLKNCIGILRFQDWWSAQPLLASTYSKLSAFRTQSISSVFFQKKKKKKKKKKIKLTSTFEFKEGRSGWSNAAWLVSRVDNSVSVKKIKVIASGKDIQYTIVVSMAHIKYWWSVRRWDASYGT